MTSGASSPAITFNRPLLTGRARFRCVAARCIAIWGSRIACPPCARLWMPKSSGRSSGYAARDLYISDWYIKARRLVESTGRPRFILSAEHCLVHPDTPLDPYETTLNTMPAAQRDEIPPTDAGRVSTPGVRSLIASHLVPVALATDNSRSCISASFDAQIWYVRMLNYASRI